MKLINVDGVNAIGKSTLINDLIKHYTKQGLKVTHVHFPRYDTEIGEVIKKVLHNEIEMHPSALQMLYSADRVNWTTYEFEQLKKEYDLILVDRFFTSGLVYGSIDGLDEEEIMYNNKLVAEPDAHLILFANIDVILERFANRNRDVRIYESAEIIKKAHDKYYNLVDVIDNVYHVNANGTKKQMLNNAVKIIDGVLMEDRR